MNLKSRIKNLGPANGTWFDKLPEDQKKTLAEVRRMFHNGEIPKYVPMLAIQKECMAEIGIKISRNSFTQWLKEEPNGKQDATIQSQEKGTQPRKTRKKASRR